MILKKQQVRSKRKCYKVTISNRVSGLINNIFVLASSEDEAINVSMKKVYGNIYNPSLMCKYCTLVEKPY